MGDPGDRGGLWPADGGDSGHHDAMLVLGGVLEAHGVQFVNYQTAELQLARRARVSGGLLVGLGIDANVAAEAV